MRKVVVASTGRLCFVIPFFSPAGAPVPVWAGATPGDISAFVSDRGWCDHFRRDGNNSGRRAAITKKLDPCCKGTTTWLAALRKQHASRSSAAQMLESGDMVG